MSEAKQISLDVVKQHNKPTDLWIIIEDKVYDVTKFRTEHPGGEDALDEVGGKDATKEFLEVGHSNDARKLMEDYYIGDLEKNHEVFKTSQAQRIGVAITCGIAGIAAGIIIVKYLTKK